MGISIKKLMNDYGIGAIIILLVVLYGIYLFTGYLGGKGSSGHESNSEMQSQYRNDDSAVQPAEAMGRNEFASASGIQTSMPSSDMNASTMQSVQNPAELLPKDTNSQWAQLNPSGKGELANINLLKAGYHIGIDTVGQSLRNANLQDRSEPPNPQLNIGPWNQSTIEPDFMRPPLEIGSGH